jgi:hypothetical protein
VDLPQKSRHGQLQTFQFLFFVFNRA